MKYTETSFTNTKEILKFPEHYIALAVTVDDAGIVADTDGKKIVPKGTIVGGKTVPTIANETEPVVKKNTQGTNASAAEGVLFYDVDVTYGSASGAMLIHGFIEINKLPEAPALDAVTALKQITFIQ